jgi:hypothetical protein
MRHVHEVLNLTTAGCPATGPTARKLPRNAEVKKVPSSGHHRRYWHCSLAPGRRDARLYAAAVSDRPSRGRMTSIVFGVGRFRVDTEDPREPAQSRPVVKYF